MSFIGLSATSLSKLPFNRWQACLLLCAALLGLVSPAWSGPVQINSADAATIAKELSGIGLKRAQAIVDYRKQNGPFRSADELALVKGIGSKTIERNRALIKIEVSRPVAKPLPPANGQRLR